MRQLSPSNSRVHQTFHWGAPFAFLGLVALALFRPAPHFPPPAPSRIVTDADGTRVAIPTQLPGVIGWPLAFLPMTHAPDMLIKSVYMDHHSFAGSILSKLFPDVLERDSVWTMPTNLESRMAEDVGGVYFYEGDARFGMILVSAWPNGRRQDETVAIMTRVMNDVIGRQSQGETLLDQYRQARSDLDNDLQQETLEARPSVIRMVAFNQNWSRLAAGDVSEHERVGAADGMRGFTATGRESDAERILAMNPDFILLAGGSIEGFMADPRWTGLKAAQTQQVYSVLDGFMDWPFAIDNVPLAARRLAEIFHPERMQPKLREVMRAHYVEAYSYRLSDEEIDNLLNVKGNRVSAGYARFTRTSRITSGEDKISQ